MAVLSMEQLERERMWCENAVAGISEANLRIIRARLADYQGELPPEPAATIIQIRGQIAHHELERRAATPFASALKRISATLWNAECTVAKYTTIPGWPTKLPPM